MNKKWLVYFLVAGILALIFFMVKAVFDQPGIEDMKAGFKEVAKYRNANNTGPVQRIYVVTVKDSVWKEMEDYGNLMPHTKYGNTKVYFFMQANNVPKTLQPGEVNFDPQFNKNCVALFEKSAMSQTAFNKNPYK
ncbi:hypothetical protein J7E50_20535 [Pedobacter sp. ISL-68]|uniref:hypothetical protein n=1 Tax=unclassified Pedobacter TaxID=2628915 RepID=UPI001BEC7AEA|nr:MULTISPECIES: hypothetical protein [unclassified Pedobacter]MBT2563976.1 hypothetical protein [Pedobacter sp. ISL-64]MBT2592617.1 hypothetical protein [Pedobacter sp. ISL-68]